MSQQTVPGLAAATALVSDCRLCLVLLPERMCHTAWKDGHLMAALNKWRIQPLKMGIIEVVISGIEKDISLFTS